MVVVSTVISVVLVNSKEVLVLTVRVALMEVLMVVSKVSVKLETPTDFVVGRERNCPERIEVSYQ